VVNTFGNTTSFQFWSTNPILQLLLLYTVLTCTDESLVLILIVYYMVIWTTWL